MEKKTLVCSACLVGQVTPSWSQICKEVYKSLAVEVGRDHFLFCMNAQYIFFNLPKINK